MIGRVIFPVELVIETTLDIVWAETCFKIIIYTFILIRGATAASYSIQMP